MHRRAHRILHNMVTRGFLRDPNDSDKSVIGKMVRWGGVHGLPTGLGRVASGGLLLRVSCNRSRAGVGTC